MAKKEIVFIRLAKRIFLFLLGVILLYFPVDLSCAEEMEGLTVSLDRMLDSTTHQYIHTPEKELTVKCSVFDIHILYLCYHQYSEEGYLLEYPMDVEDLVITKDGENVSSLVSVENPTTHTGEIRFQFREPGDYVISSSKAGMEESSVTIHAEIPTTGFFTEPYCSNRDRYRFFPYDDNNVIYYILPENTKLNDNQKVNDGYPMYIEAIKNGISTTVKGADVSKYVTYESLDESSNVYKLVLNAELLGNECDSYSVNICYNSTDDSVDWEWQWDNLQVLVEYSDRVGLGIGKISSSELYDSLTSYLLYKSVTYTLTQTNGNVQCYLTHYEYDDNQELVQAVPELDDITIKKDGVDVTSQVSLSQDGNDGFEMQLQETGTYRLIVQLENGKEDAVNLYVESYADGFYDSPVPEESELYSYKISNQNKVLYLLLTEGKKLDADNPFLVIVDNEEISSELHSEYFTYELLEGTDNAYKITFHTENREVRKFQLNAYFEYESGFSAGMTYMYVENIFLSGLTVGTNKWTEETTGETVHDVAEEHWISCSLFDIQYLYICYHEYDDNNNLTEYQLKAEELVITKDGEVVGSSVDVANNTYRKDCTSFRFKEPGDYVISSAVEGQEDSFVTIHVSEPDTGFFKEPECSNRERSFFHPYENNNVIYYIIPENTRLLENENILEGSPIDFYIETENGYERIDKDKIEQYFSFEETEENSRIYQLTFNIEKMNAIQFCDIYIYYESTNGDFNSMRNGYLRVGGEDGDQIGLMIATERGLSKFTGKYEYDMQKEITTCTKVKSEESYQIVFYDYSENNELIEIIPDLEEIRIMNNGIDVTDKVEVQQNSDGSYEMLFEEKGRYRLIATLEDGREDVVDIYAENLMYGFYSTPEVDDNELTEYKLTKNNNVVYFVLSDYMKINEDEDVNYSNLFALNVNDTDISQELLSEYFTYDLVQGTEQVYKITFNTDKTIEDFSSFRLYAYYRNTTTDINQMDQLLVINEISAEETPPEKATTETPAVEQPTTENLPTEESTTMTPVTEEPAPEKPATDHPAIGGTVGEQEVVFSDVVVNSIDEQTYCARAIEPEIMVSYQGKQLVKGYDYTVEYKNNTYVGMADAILTGIGDYTGTREVHFQIKPYQVEGLSEILKDKDGEMYSVAYTKKKITLKTAFKLSYMVGGKKHYLEPQEGIDYSVRYYNNKKIGTARIVYSFKGNYTGTVVKKFLIVPPTTKITKVKKSGKTLVISWKKVSSCDRYEIYRATSKKGKYKKLATVKGKSKVSYKDKKAKKGKTYYYKVVACKKVSGTLYKSGWSNVKKGKR